MIFEAAMCGRRREVSLSIGPSSKSAIRPRKGKRIKVTGRWKRGKGEGGRGVRTANVT